MKGVAFDPIKTFQKSGTVPKENRRFLKINDKTLTSSTGTKKVSKKSPLGWEKSFYRLLKKPVVSQKIFQIFLTLR